MPYGGEFIEGIYSIGPYVPTLTMIFLAALAGTLIVAVFLEKYDKRNKHG